MNNRILLLVFIVLLAIYGVTKIFPTKKDRSFKTELVQVDTAAVSSLIITPKDSEEFTLTRSENGWIASNEKLNVKVAASKVAELLSTIQLIKTKQIAAKKEEKWKEFEVDEHNGIRIQVYENGKKTEDFIVGKFNFNPNTKTAVSFVRFTEEVEVYAVDGFLTMTLGQDFDAFRDKGFLSLPASAEMTSITLEQSTDTINLQKLEGAWMLNEELMMDSTKMANYISSLSNISGATFADDFDELRAKDLPLKTLKIKGNDLIESIEIQCFVDTLNTERNFVMHNRAFPDKYFATDSSGLFKSVIEDLLRVIK